MHDLEPYFFDLMPCHPQIEYLESITSYTIRVGQENGISSIKAIAGLLYPESSPSKVKSYSDLPPISIQTAAKATNNSIAKMLGATFYFIGKNFGRSTEPQPLSRFLNGAISNSLRYCAICLQENPYYSLIWRFNHVNGCLKHKCMLIELCPGCNNLIPLFSIPFRIAHCPLCSADFRRSDIKKVDTEIEEKLHDHYSDLELFLSPQVDTSLLHVGEILRNFRLVNNISLVDMAKALNKSTDAIARLELRGTKSLSGKFTDYINYLGFLGVSYKNILSSKEFTEDGLNWERIGRYKKRYTIENITPLENERFRNAVNKKEINSLSNYELMTTVIQAIEELTVRGKKPYNYQVAKKLGISSFSLHRYPIIRNLLPHQNREKLRERDRREENYLLVIKFHSDELINLEKILSYPLISVVTGLPMSALLYYKKVRDYIGTLKIIQMQRKEREYIIKLETYLEKCIELEYVPKKNEILKAIGLYRRNIKNYPLLNDRITEALLMINEVIKRYIKTRQRTIAGFVRRYRIANNITQSELADSLACSRSRIKMIEKGDSRYKTEELEFLSLYLGFNLDDLLGLTKKLWKDAYSTNIRSLFSHPKS